MTTTEPGTAVYSINHPLKSFALIRQQSAETQQTVTTTPNIPCRMMLGQFTFEPVVQQSKVTKPESREYLIKLRMTVHPPADTTPSQTNVQPARRRNQRPGPPSQPSFQTYYMFLFLRSTVNGGWNKLRWKEYYSLTWRDGEESDQRTEFDVSAFKSFFFSRVRRYVLE
jgi:hypothetical protein